MRGTLTYSAESRLGVREERFVILPSFPQVPLSNAEVGYGAPTCEVLLSSRPVYQLAGAIYLAFREDKESRGGEFWKSGDDAAILQKLVARGLIARDPSGQPLVEPPPKPGVRQQILSYTLDEEAVKEAALKLMSSVTTSKPDPKTQIIHVRAASSDRAEALLMANAFARAAQIHSGVKAKSLHGTALRGIEEKIRGVAEKLETVRREARGGGEEVRRLERRMDQAVRDESDFESRIEELRMRRERVGARFEALQVMEHRLREPLPGSAEEDLVASAFLDRLRSDIASLRTEMHVNRIRWRPENPEYQKAVSRLAHMESEYRAEVSRVRERTLSELEQSLGDMDIELRSLDDRRAKRREDLRRMGEDLVVQDPGQEEAERLKKEQEEYVETRRRIEEALAVQPPFCLVEEAAEDVSTGERSPWGSLPLYLPASAAAVFLLVFLFEIRNTKVRTERNIRRRLNLPCLAVVEDAGDRDPWIGNASPTSPLSEEFNVSATLLRSLMAERGLKTLAVCGALPQEGRTTTAANLAVALARKGLSVALLDADLRNPRLHQLFNIANEGGLSGLLGGGSGDPDEFLRDTSIPRLRVLPAGPPVESPVECIDSPAMAELFRTLGERYDAVLCDSPPLLRVGDALTLARLAGASLLVVRAGRTDGRSAVEAKNLLTGVRAEVLGAALCFTRPGGGERAGLRFVSVRQSPQGA